MLAAPPCDGAFAQTSVTFPVPPRPTQAAPKAAPKAAAEPARPPAKSPKSSNAVDGKAPAADATAKAQPPATGTTVAKPAQPPRAPAATPSPSAGPAPARPDSARAASSKPAATATAGSIVPAAQATPVPASTAGSGTAAVVLQYHRFGESRYPTTNVTVAQFDAHLDELARGGFKVMPLSAIVAALRAGKPLPDRAVAITVDDAYRSFLDHAWPKLRSAGYPATLFVATDGIERRLTGLLSWDEIKAMQAQGLEVASHGHAHISYAAAAPTDIAFDLAASAKLFRDRLGTVPAHFAFPYGEASKAAIDQIRAAGFVAAFGQQSGAIGPGADLHLLPRFPFNEQFAAVERFKLTTATLPLPLADVTPQDTLLRGGQLVQRFTLPVDLPRTKDLACYHEGTRLSLRTEAAGQRLVVQAPVPGTLAKGRQRINCTMPGPGGRWMWWGTQYLVP